MNNLKKISIIFCLALLMGFVSCNEDDEPGLPIVDEYGICLTQEVNLGLPSGTIWAAWNVGASSPEQYGGYYAWGEIEEKSSYDKYSYKYYNRQTGYCTYIGTNISGTQYDVARRRWGGSWRMPTKLEFDELTTMCTWKWYQYKGVNGYKITGPNGNSIFLPAAGTCDGTSLSYDGVCGYCWSASLYDDGHGYGAWYLGFHDRIYGNRDYCSRAYGHTVRPVK